MEYTADSVKVTKFYVGIWQLQITEALDRGQDHFQ